MPYLRGVTLDRVFQHLENRPPGRRAGRDLFDAEDRGPAADRAEAPARAFLEQETYTRAVCWIASCLAEALDHAHRRGLVHLDVKPSNVLLAGDGMPMLLDFHLARAAFPRCSEPRRARRDAGVHGPRAISGDGSGPQVPTRPAAVDARATFTLWGFCSYQALSGERPSDPPAAPGRSLRRANRDVSAGLARLVSRCLAADPRRRYPDAASVAADLKRHLDHLPLRGVADLSPQERWSKWRRRSPHALTRVVAVASASLGLLALHNFRLPHRSRGRPHARFRARP